MKRKGIDIRDDQEAWLQKHEEVNLSGLVRKAIDELIGEKKGRGKEKFEGEGEGGE